MTPNDTYGVPAGEKLIPDPDCKTCHGQGRYVAGYSGRDDDGNAPLWEDCDCFIPHGVGGLAESTFPHQSPIPSLKEEKHG